MRVFISVLVLIFNLQSWTKAADIRDFQIEGISVGDSLLDYYNKKEIENKKKNDPATYYYKDNKFVDVNFNLINQKTYEYLQIAIKPEDKKYIIYSVAGQILYKDNIDKCYKDMDNIFYSIKENFDIKKFKNKTETKHPIDETGNSITTYIDIQFDNGLIAIECYDWSDKFPYSDKLLVAVDSIEFRNFLDNEAYK